LGFGQVDQQVFKKVNQVQSKELLQEVILELRKHVNIALLTVPGFELVFGQSHA
jgi:hypothetical protein